MLRRRMCLRDENSHFIAAKTTWSHGLAQPQKAEAKGLKVTII
jgi:hypothetical protein